MTTIEETGRTVEDATERALEKLGVTEDKVDVEILEEGTKGFLGLGQAPAKVRVTVKPEPEPVRTPRKPRPKRTPKPRNEAKPKAEPIEAPPPTVTEEKVEIVPAEEAAPQAAEIGQEVLQRILDGIGHEGKATVKSVDEGQVILDIEGGDTARLIGRHGQTLDAMQYLVGIITNKRLGSRVRTIVDAEGYRERRVEALTKQAQLLAKKVKETGQEAVLESMQSSERRVVHTALANHSDVYTYSEGTEPNRHLVISPKK